MPLELKFIFSIYTLKFFLFYNCYQNPTNSFSDCTSVKEELTVYMKSNHAGSFNILNKYPISKINNTNNWKEIKLNIPNLNSTANIYV